MAKISYKKKYNISLSIHAYFFHSLLRTEKYSEIANETYNFALIKNFAEARMSANTHCRNGKNALYFCYENVGFNSSFIRFSSLIYSTKSL